MALTDLRDSAMMTHLLDSLESGKDIGHYGRLVFAMVAQYFAEEDDIVAQLKKDKDFGEEEARSLYQQVTSKGYSPPNRDTILDYQKHQDFSICPNADDPDACNVYQDLTFPAEVYESISNYQAEKTE
ncbi:MAG: hypothetical protein AAFQ40_09360 [Cyanobacteria bacterium J06623_5]